MLPTRTDLDILEEVIASAQRNMIPGGAWTHLNPRYADSVKHLLDPWYCATQWSCDDLQRVVDEMPASFEDKSSEPITDALYALPPLSEAMQQRMQLREMRLLLARHPDSMSPSQTRSGWSTHAYLDRTRVYPCLTQYSGEEPHVKAFVENLLASCNNNAVVRYDSRAVQLHSGVVAALEGFANASYHLCHLARYRTGCAFHKQLPVMFKELKKQLKMDCIQYRTQFYHLLLNPVDHSHTQDTDPSFRVQWRDDIVAMLASRVIRRCMVDFVGVTVAQRVREAEAYNISSSSNHNDDVPAVLMLQYTNWAVREGWLLLGDNADDIRKLAFVYAASCESYDPVEIWTAAVERFNIAARQFTTHVLDATCNHIVTRWRGTVNHAHFKKIVALALDLKQNVLDIIKEHATRPSFAEASITPVQRMFRLLQATTRWWHGGLHQARVCDCDTNQLKYATCMLQHLFKFSIGKSS